MAFRRKLMTAVGLLALLLEYCSPLFQSALALSCIQRSCFVCLASRPKIRAPAGSGPEPSWNSDWCEAPRSGGPLRIADSSKLGHFVLVYSSLIISEIICASQVRAGKLRHLLMPAS